jgi:hypothetical protein
MALATNALATYESIGNREDLSDVIYRIDPTDTPFLSSLDKEKATPSIMNGRPRPSPPPRPTPRSKARMRKQPIQ